MKLTHTLLTLSFFLISPMTIASNTTTDEGQKLYTSYCSACHGATGGMDMNKRLAPPIAAVRLHYIGTHPDKASFVTAVTDWLANQDASKTLMRGAIRKFNIMPAITVSKGEAEKIATYIFEGKLDKPEGFEEHVQQMHGKGNKML